MTDLQYRRWKNFSLRMARRAFRRVPEKSKRFVTYCVKDFFRTLDHDYFNVNELLPVVWDEKWGMDFNQGRRSYEFLLDRVVDWDHTKSHPTWRDNFGHGTNGPYICDIVSGLEEHWNPYFWRRDGRASRRWDDRWGSRIICSIRAGMDMAVSPSAGVMGFAAGDLRRMYRGKVPDWIMGVEPLMIQHWDGVIPGVGLIPGKEEVDGTFDSLPDDARLWL